ncbi:hypothetical protein RRG08_012209 [Elysia crispata]|uniref:Uncharacterized protein n=1 Tax=Elysia crispata TaxID=231223 RepID=A0AAE0ZKV1_9GAST|nr:hypothetical protein RRG08_012209 [Elysia crispata]
MLLQTDKERISISLLIVIRNQSIGWSREPNWYALNLVSKALTVIPCHRLGKISTQPPLPLANPLPTPPQPLVNPLPNEFFFISKELEPGVAHQGPNRATQCGSVSCPAACPLGILDYSEILSEALLAVPRHVLWEYWTIVRYSVRLC